MLHAQGLFLVDSQGLRCTHGVLDLAPVQVMSRQAVIVLFLERHSRDTLKDAYALDEHLEDGLFGFGGELAIAERNVNPGLEGIVECLDTVGGEEEDALEVLE